MSKILTSHLRARSALARKIKKLRSWRGWSQEELAKQSGLHRTYVGAVERGERNISIDNIERLAIALNVTPSELLIDG